MPPENTEPEDVAEAPWRPSQRYPDAAIQIIDQSFARYRLNLAASKSVYALYVNTQGARGG